MIRISKQAPGRLTLVRVRSAAIAHLYQKQWSTNDCVVVTLERCLVDLAYCHGLDPRSTEDDDARR